jgi:hypothetical protein
MDAGFSYFRLVGPEISNDLEKIVMRYRAVCVLLTIVSTGLVAVAQEKAAEKVQPLSLGTITGAGSAGAIAVFSGTYTIGNAGIFQAPSGYVGVGNGSPQFKLDVNGGVNATTFYLGGATFGLGSYSFENVFVGFSGSPYVTGGGNTALGKFTLYSDRSGGYNTAIGARALYFNTPGYYNKATGLRALDSNTTGGSNTASGGYVLFSNTTGYNNTANGFFSLVVNSTGYLNTASGYQALASNSTGFDNTGSGGDALLYNTTGAYNTALGYSSGPDSASPNLTNTTAIGAFAAVSESNALVLGGSGSFAVKVGIGTATPSNVFTIAQGSGVAVSDGWTTYSSRRWKTNVHTLHDALGKVEQLRGVSYELKASGKHEVGVIAEEVGAVVPEVVSWDTKGKEAQGVDYSRLTARLIEATKEQQILIQKQQTQINTQQKQIAHLASRVQSVQAALHVSGRTRPAAHMLQERRDPVKGALDAE